MGIKINRVITTQYGILLISLCCLALSLYFQYVDKLVPCSLCLMQRLCVIAILGSAWLAVRYASVLNRRAFWLWQWCWEGAGLFFSARQLWLLLLSDNVNNACIPGLEVLIHYLSWLEILENLLLGSPACGQDHSQWLGFPLAAWAIVGFSAMALLSGLGWWNKRYAR